MISAITYFVTDMYTGFKDGILTFQYPQQEQEK